MSTAPICERPNVKNHSIKGYIQIGKILVHILAAIMILAVMSNKSPIIIISSLGAVAAVLMIVFQHTLLSLVANVQLSSNDVLQLGTGLKCLTRTSAVR